MFTTVISESAQSMASAALVAGRPSLTLLIGLRERLMQRAFSLAALLPTNREIDRSLSWWPGD
jgi:hypothetical protein